MLTALGKEPWDIARMGEDVAKELGLQGRAARPGPLDRAHGGQPDPHRAADHRHQRRPRRGRLGPGGGAASACRSCYCGGLLRATHAAHERRRGSATTQPPARPVRDAGPLPRSVRATSFATTPRDVKARLGQLLLGEPRRRCARPPPSDPCDAEAGPPDRSSRRADARAAPSSRRSMRDRSASATRLDERVDERATQDHWLLHATARSNSSGGHDDQPSPRRSAVDRGGARAAGERGHLPEEVALRRAARASALRRRRS